MAFILAAMIVFGRLPCAVMFDHWAQLYDRIYAARGKDYSREAAQLAETITRHRSHYPSSLLDIACGTGEHLHELSRRFPSCDLAGIDQSEGMLRIAQRKVPAALFTRADMAAFDLGRRFDVVTCLFASICYLPDDRAAERAIDQMAKHLSPGGLLLIEPGVMPERLSPPREDVMTIDEPDLKLTRRTTAVHEADAIVITFAFEVDRPAGIGAFTETQRIHIAPRERYADWFERAGLQWSFDEQGPAGMGLFLAHHPITTD
ncbi:MAG: class I SAM-dependent methyltransferase [Phycisphaerales bacterium]|nr:MAG: class I SAM-dependent methyltransferase [Phycisphaerales bacterium]